MLIPPAVCRGEQEFGTFMSLYGNEFYPDKAVTIGTHTLRDGGSIRNPFVRDGSGPDPTRRSI
jgi:hypothetical protein